VTFAHPENLGKIVISWVARATQYGYSIYELRAYPVA